MAIPTNYIDKITKDGESRDICPAAGKVRVNNENFEGADLNEVLNEVAGAIDEAASGGYAPPEGGIPATDFTQAVQDILNDVANKVDKVTGKGLSTEDFTAALKAKLDALDPYTKAQVDAAIQQAVEELGGGSVDSVTINGVNHEPINGVVDLGTVVGQQGPKGEQGDTLLVDDNFDPVTMIVNDLDTSDGTVALSARQGKILKQAIERVQANLQTVLDALANMAFTGNRPTLTAIDWTGGTFYATINKTLSGCTATDNTNNGQIVEGSTLTMTLTASSGFTLTGAIISVTNSRGQNVSYTLANNVLTIANVLGTINISVAAKAIHQISLGSGSSNVEFASGTSTEAVDGSSWTGTIQAASGYALPASIVVTMGGNTISPTYSQSTGEITIASVTGAVVITAVAEEAGAITVTKTISHATITDNVRANGTIAAGSTYQATLVAEKESSGDKGYTLDATAVSVIVNNVDKTSECWDATNKTITVANPDGNIVINVLGKVDFIENYSNSSTGGIKADSGYLAMRTWIKIPSNMFSSEGKVNVLWEKTNTSTASGLGRYLVVGVKSNDGSILTSASSLANNSGTTKEYTLPSNRTYAFVVATFKESDVTNGKITAINPDTEDEMVLFDGSITNSYTIETE